MNCKRMERILSRHVDGETSPAEAEEIRIHLGTCAGCEHRFRELQKQGFLVQQHYDRIHVPDGLSDHVAYRVRNETADAEAPRRSSRLSWAAAAAAAILLGLLSGRWLGQPGPGEWKEGVVSLIRPPIMRQLPGSETWSALNGSGYLLPGGALEVWDDGLVQIAFPGRGMVLLNEGSQFRLEETNRKLGLSATLARGEAFLNFSTSEKAFQVSTPVAQVDGDRAAVNIRVLASIDAETMGSPSFFLDRTGILAGLGDILPAAYASSGNARLIVTTKTGRVHVRHERGEFEVFAGTQMIFEGSRTPGRPAAANLEQVLSWLEAPAAVAMRRGPAEALPATVQSDGPAAVVSTIPRQVGPVAHPEETPAPATSSATPEKTRNLFPPIMVDARPEIGRITLRWVDDATTTYPVLGYEVYRSSLDTDMAVQRINDAPVPVTSPGDSTTGGVYVDVNVASDVRYVYRVTALASPRATELPTPLKDRAGLLESASSAPIEVTAMKDFVLVLTGWGEQPEPAAHILVQKWHRGRFVGQRFLVRVGDPVGHRCVIRLGGSQSSPDFTEEVDFSTGYTLVDLRKVRRRVPGGTHLGNDSAGPLTLPTQEALLRAPNGKVLELLRQP
ncbi:MAG: zf-HC2 domain-containing protein [Planctomycetes bacterium]|nr:zf-HC2 domain-containing protein [Planctomycetota bacterium]